MEIKMDLPKQGAVVLRDMFSLVRAEFDRQPERFHLPLRLGFCLKFGTAEIAAALSIEQGAVAGRLERGLGRILTGLTRTGVVTDASSVAAALSSLPEEKAPESLMRKIDGIAHEGAVLSRCNGRMQARRGRPG